MELVSKALELVSKALEMVSKALEMVSKVLELISLVFGAASRVAKIILSIVAIGAALANALHLWHNICRFALSRLPCLTCFTRVEVWINTTGEQGEKYMADLVANLSDADLIALGKTISAAIASVGFATYGSTVAKTTALEGLLTTFEDDFNASKATRAADQASTATKSISRGAYLVGLLEFLNVSKASGTAKSNMELLGVPKVGEAPPATVPLAKIDTSKRLTHTISWSDAGAANKRRPKGVMGAEIWVKLGDTAPGNEKDCVFLAVDSATPYVASYEPTDAGKIAHYMLRWRMNDGTLGTWGETVSATITG